MKILAITSIVLFASELNAQSSQTPDLIIYDDALSSPWINASWSATVDYGSTEEIQSGTSTIKVSLRSAWGALSLHHGNWGSPGVNSSSYQSFGFFVYSPTSATTLSVFFENDQGQSFPQVNPGQIIADSWVEVSIPMSQLNPSGLTVNRIAIQDISGQRRTFYIDNVRFKSLTPPPETPILALPANGGEDEPLDPHFVWNSSNNAGTYHLQIGADTGFSNPTVDQSGLTDTSLSVQSLSERATYYWRVRATNAAGTSAWSEVWSFKTERITPPPSPPLLASPQNGATQVSISPALTWNSSTGNVVYRVQVSTQTDFSSLTADQGEIQDTTFSVSGLITGTRYYWRVNASDVLDSSDWSEVWSFTTVSPPPAPQLASPTNGETGVPRNPTFVWRSAAGAGTYRIQISTAPNFGITVADQGLLTDTSYTANGLQEVSTYYWRVNATNDHGTSEWSQVWSFTTRSSWNTLSSPASSALLGIAFADSNKGIAVGQNGTILNTSDGGNTWTLRSGGTSAHLHGLAVVNALVASAVGDAGTILRTTDGGNTWFTQPSGINTALFEVSFTDENTGTTVGENGTILRTTNGGVTWTPQSSGTSFHLYGVSFVNANNGVAVGGVPYYPVHSARQTILQTTNGGVTWQERLNPYFQYQYGPWFNAVSFADEFSATAVGANGTAMRTTDGGYTWNFQSTGTDRLLHGAAFNDASTGTAIGELGTVLQTSDGGVTWTVQPTGTSAHLYAVSGVSKSAHDTWTVAGQDGIILQKSVPPNSPPLSPTLSSPFNGESGVSITPVLTWQASERAVLYQIQISSDPTFSSISFNQKVFTGTSYSLGGRPNEEVHYWRVRAENSGGFSSWSGPWSFTIMRAPGGWQSQSSGVTEELGSPYSLDSSTAVVVGEHTILHTTNSGTTWERRFYDPNGWWGGVSFLDDNSGVIVGAGDHTLRTTDRGASWQPHRVIPEAEGPVHFILIDVDFADEQKGAAVGGDGGFFAILHTTDAGLSWNLAQTDYSGAFGYYLRSVSFGDAMTGIAVGDYGAIMRTTDAGASWTRVGNTGGLQFGLYLSDVELFADNTGIAIGTQGVFTTNDGGLTWTIVEDLQGVPLARMSFVDERIGTAVGTEGTIIQTTDGFASWNRQFGGTRQDLLGVSFISATTGFATGKGGVILRTTTGGFSRPLPPVLVSPVDGDTERQTELTVAWKTSLGGQSYRLQVSTDPQFSGLILNQGDLSDTTYTLENLAAATTYYWRVNASNTAGTGDWSIEQSFSTISEVPEQPLLASPPDGAANQPTDLNLLWRPAKGANAYRLQISTDSTFTQVFIDSSDIPDTSLYVQNLGGSTFYYWRVTGSNSYGEGEWSNIWGFTTERMVWVMQNSGVTTTLTDIDFINSATGTAVGVNGTILRTTNGGIDWVIQESGTSANLTGVSFANAMSGWAVGTNGTILRTSDGGDSWEPQISNTTHVLWEVEALSALRANIVGGNNEGGDGIVLTTTNGGENWNFQEITSRPLFALDFANSTVGWSTGRFGRIFRTLDGGETWAQQQTGTQYYLVAVSFVDDQHGWAMEAGGVILSTVNGGSSWSTQRVNAQLAISDIRFTRRLEGICVGDGGQIFRTSDGGVTWLGEASGTTEYLLAVTVAGSMITAVGEGGVILRTATEALPPAPLLSNPADTKDFVSVNPILQWFKVWEADTYWLQVSPDTVFSAPPVNEEGLTATSFILSGLEHSTTYYWRVRGTNANGTSDWSAVRSFITAPKSDWTVQSSGTSEHLAELSFSDQNTGTVVGQNGTILRTTNGGMDWHPQSSGTTNNLTGVSFVDSVYGWVVGTNGTILHTTDGGSSWSPQNSNTPEHLWEVDFTSRTHGCAVGGPSLGTVSTSVLLTTSDGGTTWVKQPVSSSPLFAVDFVNSQTGWVTGRFGTILKTADGGQNWTPQGTTQYYLTCVSFVDNLYGWAMEAGGVILRTINGGISWTTRPSGTGHVISDLWFTDRVTGILVGDAGTIFRTTDAGNSWQREASGTTEMLLAVTVAGRATIAVGLNGLIIRHQITEAPGLLVFGDNLEPPWINASWNASISFGSTEQAYHSATSIKTELTSAWGALSLHHGNWGTQGLNTANYRSMDFLVYPLAENSHYAIFFENDQGQSFPKFTTGTIAPNSWTPISVPMHTLNSSGLVVNRLAIQDLSGGRRTFYMDSLRFSGALFSQQSLADAQAETNAIPDVFTLSQNYPNPFNPTTTIRYGLPEDAVVRLEVYNILGERIQTLVDAHQKAGYHQTQFGRYNSGIASGVYFYRLIARSQSNNSSPFVEVRKMFLVK